MYTLLSSWTGGTRSDQTRQQTRTVRENIITHYLKSPACAEVQETAVDRLSEVIIILSRIQRNLSVFLFIPFPLCLSHRHYHLHFFIIIIMGNWQLEAGKMCLYVFAPISAFYLFHQVDYFEDFIKSFQRKQRNEVTVKEESLFRNSLNVIQEAKTPQQDFHLQLRQWEQAQQAQQAQPANGTHPLAHPRASLDCPPPTLHNTHTSILTAWGRGDPS
ncbi:hypothetical protein TCAL_16414 [Tigriopus californicus]|uniref:Uncharacterized protein n=1 Tax=Tigriopus californicus TaxID=6832 RepID=A0A553P043_TIGCA|nr:hypothetical protein TCAL_16414 [Tigriopus californicus]